MAQTPGTTGNNPTAEKLGDSLKTADAVNPKPPGSTDATANSAKVDFTGKLHSGNVAKDAQRDQNFDGTLQKGKDTLTDGVERKVVPTDAAAESSTLTVNEMLATKSAGPATNAPVVVEPGSAMVTKEHKDSTDTKYYRSSVPTFNFRFAKGRRARFSHYWLKTNDSTVQDYVESNLMHMENIRVHEGTKEEYEHEKTLYGDPNVIVNAQPLPNQSRLDARRVREIALSAKAPRTDANPGLMEPETGNAQQDHFTQFKQVQTDDLRRPVVDDRLGPTERQRAVQERNATGGGLPAVDTKANTPLPNEDVVK